MELSFCNMAFGFSFSVRKNFSVFHFRGSIYGHCCHLFCSLSYFSLISLAHNMKVIYFSQNLYYDDDTFSVDFSPQFHFPMASAKLVCALYRLNHSNILNSIGNYYFGRSSFSKLAYSNGIFDPVYHSTWTQLITFYPCYQWHSYWLRFWCRNSDSVVIL